MVSKLTSQAKTFSTSREPAPKGSTRLSASPSLVRMCSRMLTSRDGRRREDERLLREQGLGDVPGEADIITHAGNQGHLAAQIQRDHSQSYQTTIWKLGHPHP